MNSPVSPEAEPAIADVAQRYGLSREAVLSMLVALQAGGGTMAQFSIPELGGSGQWMRGGMTMVGNMFDNALKARVDGLCNELAQLLSTTTVFPGLAAGGSASSGQWWPADLGAPSATGGQNDTRYAVFPGARRLAIHAHGVTRVFDTGEHHIGGVQQQQGGPSGTLSFTSQLGTFDITSLRELDAQPQAPTTSTGRHAEPTRPTDAAPAPTPGASPSADPSADPSTIIAAIESLAGLNKRGILSDEEFAAKKTELLGRL